MGVRRCGLAVAAALAVLIAAPSAYADTALNVNTAGDGGAPGKCSLREAIAYANANSGAPVSNGCGSGWPTAGVTINVPAASTHYTLTAGQLSITGTENVSIVGADPATTIIDGDNASAVLNISGSSKVQLQRLTITGGRGAASAAGIVNGGNLTLDQVIVSNNHDVTPPGNLAADGGGISSIGQLTVRNSQITGNSAGAGASADSGSNNGGSNGGSGGGIFSPSGSLTISNSSVTDNSAGRGGTGDGIGQGGNGGNAGGIYAGGSLTITASTIANNSAGAAGGGSTAGSGGVGGGLYDYTSATSSIQNSTIANNSAPGGSGGGIYANSVGLTLQNLTLADNTGGGIDNAAGSGHPVSATNSIFASNAGANCSGAVTDSGYNVAFGDITNTCPSSFHVGDPKLGSLTNNGGPTQTMALGGGSAALDLIPTVLCQVAVDQRGIARPQPTPTSNCDAGAYEVAAPVITSPAATATGQTTGSVTASVNTSLPNTTVVVKYGTTTAYGSTTAAQTIGSGNSPAAFSVSLAGLQPGTLYHAEIVATNTDGSSSSADLTFTTASSGPAGCTKNPLPTTTISTKSFNKKGLKLTGKAFAPCPDSISSVSIAIAKVKAVKKHKRCAFLGANHKFGKFGSCTPRKYLPARGTARWSFTIKLKPAKGTYWLWQHAVDNQGKATANTAKKHVTFTI